MSRVVVPRHPISGQPEVVEDLVANDEAIASVVNGDLDAEVNVKTGPPTAALTGAANSEGSASTLLRSDAQFIIQGAEQLSTDPTSGHFPGRWYFNTADQQHKYCSNVSTGTYTPFTNVGPTEVPIHGSAHGQLGGDPLPDGGVGSDMLGRSIQTVTLGTDVPNIKTAFLTVITMSQITCPASQVVSFSGKVICHNLSGTSSRLAWRIIDTDNANAVVSSASAFPILTGGTTTVGVSDFIQAATGNHTYRLQVASADIAVNGCDITKDATTVVDGVTTHTYLNLLVG